MTNDPAQRFASHKSGALNGRGINNYFYNAIRKHGIENFKMEILAIFDNKEDCARGEVAVITFNKKQWYSKLQFASWRVRRILC